MKTLIFFFILIAAHVGEGMISVDCSRVSCLMLPEPPNCTGDTVLMTRTTPLNGDCCNPFECRRVCYTQWFDRDDPSATGDYETLANLRVEYPNRICRRPLNIQATTISGVPAASIGQVIQTFDTVSGFVCVNSQQRNGECCLDYKVRFGCPCPWL